MKIKKKLLVFLVAFATALNLMPTIYATSLKNNVGHVAEINREGVTYSFDTLDEAVQKAKDSETITVLKDCTTEAGFNMSKNLKVKGKNGVKPTITFTKYGIALWAKSLTFEDLNIVMNGIGSTPYYQEWGWMTICGQSNSKLNLVNTNMKMDGQKLNKHAIYADNGLKLYMKDSNLVIKNYGQDALEWNGGSFDYNIEMIDSTYLSDCNRSGFTGTFKVKATRSNIDVLNSHGNGSNGSNFYFYDSHVNFSDNKSHGLSATVLESTNTPITAKRNGLYGIVARYVEFDNCKGDSRILAEGNKWNGIRIGLDSSSKHKFVVKNSDINVIDNGYKKDTDTWSGLVLRHVPAASMDKKSTLTVTGNANNGIRMYANSHFTIEEGTPVIIMNNNSTLKGGNGEGGGVRIVENSSLVLPSHAKLYNNHADKAGDDIFLQDGSEITFGDTGNDWVLDGTPNTKDCLKAIDGWYDDRANTDTEFNRWDAHSIEEFHVRKMNSGTYNKLLL